MRLLWTLLCRRAIVDEQFKSASLIDLLDGIDVGILDESAPAPEAIPFEFSLVSLWSRSDAAKAETSSQRVRVIRPDKSESEPITSTINLSGHRNWRNIVQFQGLKLRGPGDYAFVIELGTENEWVEHGRVNLAVTLVPGKQQ